MSRTLGQQPLRERGRSSLVGGSQAWKQGAVAAGGWIPLSTVRLGQGGVGTGTHRELSEGLWADWLLSGREAWRVGSWLGGQRNREQR